MPKSCAVVGCHNHSMMAKRMSFFLFPKENKDPKRLELWLAALNRANPDGTPWRPGRYVSICSEHFVTGRPNHCREHIDYVPSLFFYPTDGPPLVKGLDRRSEALTLKRQKEATKTLWLEEMRSQMSTAAKKGNSTSLDNEQILLGNSTQGSVRNGCLESATKDATPSHMVKTDSRVSLLLPEQDPDVEIMEATPAKRRRLRKARLGSQSDIPPDTSSKGSPSRGSTFQRVQNERLRMTNLGLRQENQKLKDELKKCKKVIAKFIEIRQKMQKLGFKMPQTTHSPPPPRCPSSSQNIIKIEPIPQEYETFGSVEEQSDVRIGEVWSLVDEGSLTGAMRTVGVLKIEPLDYDGPDTLCGDLDPNGSTGIVKIEPMEPAQL